MAVNALQQHAALTGDKTPAVVVSTASPFKFAQSILPAIGIDFQGDDFQLLEALEIVSGQKAPAALKELKGKPVRFESVIEKNEMKQAVLHWLED